MKSLRVILSSLVFTACVLAETGSAIAGEARPTSVLTDGPTASNRAGQPDDVGAARRPAGRRTAQRPLRHGRPRAVQLRDRDRALRRRLEEHRRRRHVDESRAVAAQQAHRKCGSRARTSASVTHRGRMYVIGGQNFESKPNPDLPGWLRVPAAGRAVPADRAELDVLRRRVEQQGRRHLDTRDDDAPWAGRAGLSAVVHDGAIYVLGGSQGDDASTGGTGRVLFNDVWMSRDGRSWTEVADKGAEVGAAGRSRGRFEGRLHLPARRRAGLHVRLRSGEPVPAGDADALLQRRVALERWRVVGTGDCVGRLVAATGAPVRRSPQPDRLLRRLRRGPRVCPRSRRTRPTCGRVATARPGRNSARPRRRRGTGRPRPT